MRWVRRQLRADTTLPRHLDAA